MDDHHRKILQTSFVLLTKNIRNVEDVCDYLVAEEVLTFEMLDTIQTAQVRELISTLSHHGKQAYESFIHALRKTENQDLADFLRSKERSEGETAAEILHQLTQLQIANSAMKETIEFINNDHIQMKEENSALRKDVQQIKEKMDELTLFDGGIPVKSGKSLKDVSDITDRKRLLLQPEIEVKAEDSQNMSAEWPNFKKPGSNFRKKDLKKSDKEIFSQIMQERKETYSMAGMDKGKFILISNVACPTVCPTTDTEETENNKRETVRRSKCRNNIDFDTTNIMLVLKAIGLKSGGQIKNKASQEIIVSLTSLLDEIDKDAEANFDSLVVIIISGKIDCKEARIYDKDGNNVSSETIQQIIKESRHFKGKPKIVFIQTYNFEEISPFDELETASNEIIKRNDPNSDDLFVVSSYPRIDQGPWIIGENMSGSYFIQALIYIFTNHAYNKSFLDLMGELQKCLVNAVVPEMTNDRKNKDKLGRKDVADVVLLEHSKQKELYLFPGYTHEIPKLELNYSDLLDGPVCQPSA